MNVNANTHTIHQSQRTKYDVTLDRFDVRFGYKGRDSIQMRLDGDDVYLSDWRDARPFGEERGISVTVPFELLAGEWVRFIQFLQAKHEEAKAGSDE